MAGPYDVERALRDGLAWSREVEPAYPTHRWLLRILWPTLLALLAAVAITAAYVGMLP